MTKKELHARHGDKVAVLQTDLTYTSIIECAREEMPLGIIGGEPTSIIRNEGRMQGWISCLNFLKSIGKQKVEEPAPQATQLYANPNADNQKTK